MKGILLGGAVVLALAAAGGWYYANQDSTLTVRALLTEGGTEVTDQLTWDLDKVLGSEGSDGVTFTYVETYAPTEDGGHTYVVDPSEPIEVRAFAMGNAEIEEVIEIGRGDAAEEVFVLGAGQINATFRAPDNMPTRLQIDNPSQGTGLGQFPEGEEGVIFLTPGEYSIAFINDAATDAQRVTVEAGQVMNMTFDARVASVRFALAGDLAWPDELPPVTFTLPDSTNFGGTMARTTQGGVTEPVQIRFGTHRVVAEVARTDGFSTNVSVETEVTVDAIDPQIAVPVEFQLVTATISGLPADAEDVQLRVIETLGKGERVASADVVGDAAVLAFDDGPFSEDAFTFGLALWVDRKVLAITEIGNFAPGTAVMAEVTVGDGAEKCDYLFGADLCAMN